nr:rep protein [Cressdnaviricota sp.]
MNKQFRHFAFTWFYEDVANEQLILKSSFETLGANYWVCGYESCPSTNKKHIQGYCQLSKRKYFSQVKESLPKGVHLEMCKGSSDDNITYCKKSGEFWESGEFRSVARGRAKQAADWALLLDKAKEGKLDEIATDNPREYIVYYNTFKRISVDNINANELERKCLWIYGPPGCGKSRVIHKLFPSAYWKNSNKWWDGYRGEYTVVLDDFDTAVLFGYLKRWADRYKVIGEAKGSSVNLAYSQFVISSNYSIVDLGLKELLVDQVTIEAISRRFLLVQAVEWSDLEEDLLVLPDLGSKDLKGFVPLPTFLRPYLESEGWHLG